MTIRPATPRRLLPHLAATLLLLVSICSQAIIPGGSVLAHPRGSAFSATTVDVSLGPSRGAEVFGATIAEPKAPPPSHIAVVATLLARWLLRPLPADAHFASSVAPRAPPPQSPPGFLPPSQAPPVT